MAESSVDRESSSIAREAVEPLAEAVAIMERLRGPGGCPWDREQTFESIKRHTLEETYEVFDAIERRAWADLKDELGDLLLQVLFYAQMASEAGYFTIADVARGLNAKLVRRHPHIFRVDGVLVEAIDAGAVLRNWEAIKREEKLAGLGSDGGEFRSALDGIPRTMPGMMEVAKLGSKAAEVGFDWPSADGLFAKLAEEISEVRAEVGMADSAQGPSGTRVSEEFGDVLFTAVNLARHLKLDAESSVRVASAKFRARFAEMERAAGGFERLRGLSPEELDKLWAAAKRQVPAREQMGGTAEEP